MKAPAPILLPTLLLLATGSGCGEVRTLETRFTPSLQAFTEQVQPVLDAQTCGRGPDEARGVAGCHTPKQGGLQLFHKPRSEDQVVANYRAAVAFIDLHDPTRSELLLAPLNGPLPPGAGDEGKGGGMLQVDHPDYAGRFTSTDDCCYCTILLWICGDTEGNPGCDACRAREGCTDCQPLIECVAGGAPEKGAENAEVFRQVVDAVIAGCGGCHSGAVPPTLNTAAAIQELARDPDHVKPCEAKGKFLTYLDGNNNDPFHANTVDAEQRGRAHVWVEELGAPTCLAGGAGTPDEAAAFEEVAGFLVSSCNGCHGIPPALKTVEDVRALAGNAAYVTPCQEGGKLLLYADGVDATHHGLLSDEQKAELHAWIEELGAAAP